MSAKVLQILKGRIAKERITLHFKSEIKDFDFIVKHMQKEIKLTLWSSAWIIHYIMKNNDERLQKLLHKIINSIKGKN